MKNFNTTAVISSGDAKSLENDLWSKYEFNPEFQIESCQVCRNWGAEIFTENRNSVTNQYLKSTSLIGSFMNVVKTRLQH